VDDSSIVYSKPYSKISDEVFCEGNFRLKNLVTGELDVVDPVKIINVELFMLSSYSESLNKTVEIASKRFDPILSEPYKTLSRKNVENMMFLDGMNVNYMRILDFMEYTSPKDFDLVNFDRFKLKTPTDEEADEAYKNFSKIVLKKSETIISDISRNLGKESEPIVADITQNVTEFLDKIREIPVKDLQNHWPTLINPSPYYFHPTSAERDG
jgi:hypothetical protein